MAAEIGKCGKGPAEHPQNRSGETGPERYVSGDEHEKYQARISQSEDAQIDPVAPSAVSDIEGQGDRDGRHAKEQQVPGILEDLPLRHPRLKGGAAMVDRIRRLQVQTAPECIDDRAGNTQRSIFPCVMLISLPTIDLRPRTGLSPQSGLESRCVARGHPAGRRRPTAKQWLIQQFLE